MMVCLFHWAGMPAGQPVLKQLPVLESVLHFWGGGGIAIFFVISGFVITHSLRRVPPTARHIGNFIVRRHIRLDPLYWSVLAFAVFIMHYPLPNQSWIDPPNWRSFVVSMFYLQNILGSRPIDPVHVSWTLCLEIQFYLFFVLLIVLHEVARRLQTRTSQPSDLEKRWLPLSWLMFSTGIGTLVFWPDSVSDNHIWFFQWWPLFATGSLAYLSLQGKTAPYLFFLFNILLVIIPFHYGLANGKGNSIASLLESLTCNTYGSLCAFCLLWCGWKSKNFNWEKQRILLFFGRISYSFYLTHAMIFILFIDAVSLWTANPSLLTGAWFLALPVSVLVACLVHRCIERPTRLLASRLKLVR